MLWKVQIAYPERAKKVFKSFFKQDFEQSLLNKYMYGLEWLLSSRCYQALISRATVWSSRSWWRSLSQCPWAPTDVAGTDPTTRAGITSTDQGSASSMKASLTTVSSVERLQRIYQHIRIVVIVIKRRSSFVIWCWCRRANYLNKECNM